MDFVRLVTEGDLLSGFHLSKNFGNSDWDVNETQRLSVVQVEDSRE